MLFVFAVAAAAAAAILLLLLLLLFYSQDTIDSRCYRSPPPSLQPQTHCDAYDAASKNCILRGSCQTTAGRLLLSGTTHVSV